MFGCCAGYGNADAHCGKQNSFHDRIKTHESSPMTATNIFTQKCEDVAKTHESSPLTATNISTQKCKDLYDVDLVLSIHAKPQIFGTRVAGIYYYIYNHGKNQSNSTGGAGRGRGNVKGNQGEQKDLKDYRSYLGSATHTFDYQKVTDSILNHTKTFEFGNDLATALRTIEE